jgi:murein DD-endopeptidase MepM/ murein hydrolase activator NlpD
MGSYGIMVEIDHGHGITTRYAHLSRTLVDAGDHVAPRAPVGIIGSTGRSTGRHLHYEVHLDGRPVDPARFIAAGRRLLGLLGS